MSRFQYDCVVHPTSTENMPPRITHSVKLTQYKQHQHINETNLMPDGGWICFNSAGVYVCVVFTIIVAYEPHRKMRSVFIAVLLRIYTLYSCESIKMQFTVC